MKDKINVYLRILLGIAAGPGLLLVLPFLLNSLDYGRVYGFIAVVQLLSLFSSLGLEIVAARENLPFHITFLTLFITTLLATIVYAITQSTSPISLVSCMSFGTALANNVSLVVQNSYLFKGDTGLYARFGLYRAALLIITLLACMHAGLDVEISWVVASIASIVMPLLIIKSSNLKLEVSSIKQLPLAAILNTFYAAFPMAALNSLNSLPFVAERLIAKGAFNSELFPKYAICATLASPMVYLGNMTQNYLISHNERIDKLAAIGGAKLLLSLCGGYILVLVLVATFVLPPYFHDLIDFYTVALPCTLWVFIYCVSSFPLAAIMQKQADVSTLAKCALVSFISVAVLYGCYELIRKDGILLDLPWKTAIASALFSIVLVMIRGGYIWPLAKRTTVQ